MIYWTMFWRIFALNDLILLLVAAIWAVNLSVIKLALRQIPYLPFNALRLLIAGLFLFFFAGFKIRISAIKGKDLLKILWLAVSGITIYQYLFMKGIDLTSASNTGLIFGTSPIFIAILSSYFKHERLSWINWLGVAFGFVGLYLVISGQQGFSLEKQFLAGDLILLLAVILWAYYSVSARPLLKKYSPLEFSAMTMIPGSILFLLLNLNSVISFNWSHVSFPGWMALVFSGVLALSVAMILWFRSVQKVGNSRTAVYSNLQPPLALFFAALLLKERISWNLLAGMCIILGGIVLTKLKKREQ